MKSKTTLICNGTQLWKQTIIYFYGLNRIERLKLARFYNKSNDKTFNINLIDIYVVEKMKKTRNPIRNSDPLKVRDAFNGINK
jgi:hypothetical protein